MSGTVKRPKTETFRGREVQRLQLEDLRPDRRPDEFLHQGTLYRILGSEIRGEKLILRCERVE
jgi:hypothetical protein